jgi:phosphodiesterase/alkaline phosphatase D-like protein
MRIINHTDLPENEIIELAQVEAEHYGSLPKYKNGIQSIEFYQEDGEIWSKVTPVPAEIRRVRRITGYLSQEENFNAAKFAELKARVAHE